MSIGPDSISLQISEEFLAEDPGLERLSRLFRETFDQAYDGQHTGRYCLDQLSKTERAHIGSLLEINIRREFDGFINDGEVMDYDIDGYEVDCKYSKNPFGWMIPKEALGHHAMLCHADDARGLWRVGFIHVTEEVLNSGKNQDQKRTISRIGREAITWLAYDQPFPPNTLLLLPENLRTQVLKPTSGAARLNMLFRLAQGTRIPRGVVATVAQQKDYMKRLRYNGGSRSALQPEGIIILGDYWPHRNIAKKLGLPIPVEGDSVSARIVKTDLQDCAPSVEINGELWRLARDNDPIEPAPIVPFK